uniref:C2 domain-containing protein n=1 Tax=Kalanchoe fedtschenkoi TaxID=63787 RepID=A0A7N1A1Z3_KALFE
MLGRLCGSGADSRVGYLEMENITGLLKVRVIRGVNLAIRDIGRRSSDPYVTLSLGHQKVKTRVVHRNCNPEWNEELTLCATNSDLTIHLAVFDHDTFSADDKMGEAEIDIKPYLKCYNNLSGMMAREVGKGEKEGALVSTVQPTKQNCLARESRIVWKKGKLVQEMSLALREVECGDVDIEIELKAGAF